MPDFDRKFSLSYSTLKTLGLGAGSSNTTLQGSMGGTSAPYKAFPYGGGHIPPSSPSLDGAHQHSAGRFATNLNNTSFGVGYEGLTYYNMSVGSPPFSLLDMFGNKVFSLDVISVGGNPGYGQQNPMEGTIPTQGENLGIPSSQGLWNFW
jgi:hypothetical protein